MWEKIHLKYNNKKPGGIIMKASRRIYWPAVTLIGPGCVKEIGADI